MLMKMDTLWFINSEPDFEREQWTLLAYLRDAEVDLEESRLEPFYTDLKRRLQDIECFLTTRTLISTLTKAERKRLTEFNERDDDCKENQEVFGIVRWGQKKLKDIKKEYNSAWRTVESSFNIFYVGDKPTVKIDKGVLFIRYAGSNITEVYKFWKENGKAMFTYLEYTEDEYQDIKMRLEEEYPGSTFIIAESQIAFDTKITSMPFLASTLEKKVMS